MWCKIRNENKIQEYKITYSSNNDQDQEERHPGPHCKATALALLFRRLEMDGLLAVPPVELWTRAVVDWVVIHQHRPRCATNDTICWSYTRRSRN